MSLHDTAVLFNCRTKCNLELGTFIDIGHLVVPMNLNVSTRSMPKRFCTMNVCDTEITNTG